MYLSEFTVKYDKITLKFVSVVKLYAWTLASFSAKTHFTKSKGTDSGAPLAHACLAPSLWHHVDTTANQIKRGGRKGATRTGLLLCFIGGTLREARKKTNR